MGVRTWRVAPWCMLALLGSAASTCVLDEQGTGITAIPCTTSCGTCSCGGEAGHSTTSSGTGGSSGSGGAAGSGGLGGGGTAGAGGGGQGGGTLVPTDFAGLELWLRADVGVTLNAGHVQSWLDQSGQGNHASQSVPNAQPTFQAGVFNGHPAVDFDGTADRLLIADADGLDPGQDSFLCVAAGRWLGGFGNYDVWSGKTDDASADDWRLYRMANGTLRVYWGGVGDGYNTSTAIASDGVNYVLGWGYDATSSEVLYVVGSTTERLSAAAQGLGQNGQPMVIGADTVAYWAQMRLAEEVFYKRIGTGFPSSEVDQIVEYFRVRYGL